MKEERLKKKPEGVSEVLAWVNKSRQIEEKRKAEKEKALQLSKIFEEQDSKRVLPVAFPQNFMGKRPSQTQTKESMRGKKDPRSGFAIVEKEPSDKKGKFYF
nr:SART-1 family protein DOT2 [Ipomoea batatas]